jgi:hypothetical protein
MAVWSKTLRVLWKLCGLTEAQCAVVNTLFIEVLLLWILFIESFVTVDLLFVHDLANTSHYE